MRLLIVALVGLLLAGCNAPDTPQGRLAKAKSELAAAKSDESRFYVLNEAAKQSFEVGDLPEAQKYADELLRLAAKFSADWNYGNAIHDGNMVLGRIALKNGNVAEARKNLLAAGKTPGSPQLDSFGPNMSLANDFLKSGEKNARNTVVEYFNLCRKFWKMGPDKLDQWTREVQGRQMPNFGANLVY